MSEAYYVDIPSVDGPFWHVATFPTFDEAAAFCQEHFGTDADGRLSLISPPRDTCDANTINDAGDGNDYE